MRRAPRALWQGAACLALAGARGVAAEPVPVELWLALDGGTRTGSTAEIRVRIGPYEGGPLRLELDGVSPATSVRLSLRAGESRELRVAAVPAAGRPIAARVVAQGGGAGSARYWPSRVSAPGEHVVAVAGRSSLDAPPGVTARPIAVDALPVNTAGYGAVSALALDARALARMDLRQQRALEGYLAGCGRVVALALPAAAARALQEGAGCGARSLLIARDAQEASRQLTELLAAGSGASPGPRGDELAALADARRETGPPLALFLAGYGVLAVAVALGASWVWSFGLPVAGSALALALWYGAPPAGGLVLWVEQDVLSGARASAHLALRARGRHTASVPLPEGMLPVGLNEDLDQVRRVIESGEGGGQAVALEVPTRLMSQASITLRGIVPARAPLDLRMDGELPLLVNPGPGVRSGTVLLWRHRGHAVPDLEAGGRWRPGPGTRSVDGAAVRLALARIGPAPAALLSSVEAPRIPGVASRGWLFLRAAAAAPGISVQRY